MLTLIEAMGYVSQLSSLRRMPREPKALKAVGEQLARLARDTSHAERIVANLLDHNTEWPGPGRMRDVALEVDPSTERERTAPVGDLATWKRDYHERIAGGLCKHCEGFGLLYLDDGTAVRCSCPEGRPKWVTADGRPCPPDTLGAVLHLSDESIEKFNRAIKAKRSDMASVLRRRNA